MFAGAQLKEDYYRAQEEWLEDEENLKKWEEQTISAGDRRILITHWLAEAAERFRKRGTCAASWSRTGCGMSIDGSGDDAIVVSGVPNYSFAEPVVAVDEQPFQGIDEAEAKQADSEEPPTSKREIEKKEEDVKDDEDDEDDEDEDEDDEEQHESGGEEEPEYWVQCDLDKCQKWRKLPTPWGVEQEFTCESILRRCGQSCDSCHMPRCVCVED